MVDLVIENQTFNDGDLAWGMYNLARFVGCTFKGTARDCNFMGATFSNCAFDPDFSFVSCNIRDAVGLPLALQPPSIPEIPKSPIAHLGRR